MAAKVNKNYRELRSKLIARGYTLRSWATKHGYHVNTVYDAAKGRRHGVRATEIKKQLEEAIRE